MWFLAIIFLVINLPLFYGANTDRFAFYPDLIKQGKWWLIFTSQFAHITWYHFLLDVVPFFLVFSTLNEKLPIKRLVYVIFAGTGTILAAILFANISEYGLSGFSGITYGIIGISSLEMIMEKGADKIKKTIGVVAFTSLVALIAYELITGKFPFNFLLFDMVGNPVFVGHLGGVVGALLIFLILRIPKLQSFKKIKTF